MGSQIPKILQRWLSIIVTAISNVARDDKTGASTWSSGLPIHTTKELEPIQQCILNSFLLSYIWS